MRLSPPQARLLQLLRDSEGKCLRVWFAIVELVPIDAAEEKHWPRGEPTHFRRQTAMTCVRLGFLERLPSQEGYRYGETASYFRLSELGRASVADLVPSAFISRRRERPKPPPGEAGRILRALANRHNPERGWLFLIEGAVTIGPGLVHHVDGLAINLYHSQKYRRVVYEVKVTRSDFFAELRVPEKTRRSAWFASEFYFACPDGLVKPSEVPEPYGLVVVFPKGTSRIVKRCSTLPPVQPTWALVGRLLLQVSHLEEETDDAPIT